MQEGKYFYFLPAARIAKVLTEIYFLICPFVLIQPALSQAAHLDIHYLTIADDITSCDALSLRLDYGLLIMDTLLMKERKRSAGYESTTFGSRGMYSTLELQPLPY